MKQRVGEHVQALRGQKGWTQDHLAAVTGLSSRTIQRLESGRGGQSLQSLQAFAAVFGCDVSRLQRGLSASELTSLQDDFLCPSCGARMIEQTSVPHAYGDSELEVFACGFTRGWTWRPCPRDPRFPAFDDYELILRRDDQDSAWWCHAVGRTAASRAVPLQVGRGKSEEEAKSQVLQSYVSAQRGNTAPEGRRHLVGLGALICSKPALT
jgi:transcriptional regulator with XRE-family HTH domain